MKIHYDPRGMAILTVDIDAELRQTPGAGYCTVIHHLEAREEDRAIEARHAGDLHAATADSPEWREMVAARHRREGL